MAQDKQRNFYSFNLLTPPTEEEKVIAFEKDNTVFYSVVLIFIAFIIFIMFSIIHLIVVLPKKNETISRISKLDEQIRTFDEIKAQNGELYIKSQILEPILREDIKIAELLDIASRLVENINTVEIKSYSRKSDGDFIVLLDMQSFLEINKVIENSKLIKEVQNVFVTRLTKNYSTNIVEGALTFSVVL